MVVARRVRWAVGRGTHRCENLRGRANESQAFSKAHVRFLPDHQAQGRDSRHLQQEPPPQAAAGLTLRGAPDRTPVHLALGAEVRTAEGRLAGLLSGVVVDPSGWVVTHILVHRGVVVAVDRVVARADIQRVQDHRVELGLTAKDLDEMPELEERAYVPLTGVDVGSEAHPALSPPGLWTRTPAVALPPLVSDHTTDEANVVEAWRNIPEGSVVLREGLEVRVHSGAAVGKLREVAIDPATGALSAILISRAGHLKAVPAAWIERGDEKTGIVLAVDRPAVDELPDDHAELGRPPSR